MISSLQYDATFNLDGSPRQGTSADIQPLPPSAAILTTAEPVAKRRAKKIVHPDTLEFKERVGRLGTAERRILNKYAGDTTETRTRALEKFEDYRQQNNNQPPIISRDSQQPAAGPNKVEWICRICSITFSTFQKAAVHLTSNEWGLGSWPCPIPSCRRTYQALDQLRRHRKLHHPNAPISTEGETSPSPNPSPQTETIDAVVEYQQLPLLEPPDVNGQVTAEGNHVGTGIGWTSQQRRRFGQRPRGIIPRSQLQALSMFDEPPPRLPLPVLNQFTGTSAPNSYHTSVPSTSISMNANTIPLDMNNAGQQIRLTEDTQHGQIDAIGFPDFSQSNINHDFAAQWHDDLAFRQIAPSSSSLTNTSDFSMNKSHGRMYHGSVDAPWYFSDPSQPGPSASSASQSFGRPVNYSRLPTHSRNYSAQENEMVRQMTLAFPSSGQSGSQDDVGSVKR